jgi:hypothetical protein
LNTSPIRVSAASSSGLLQMSFSKGRRAFPQSKLAADVATEKSSEAPVKTIARNKKHLIQTPLKKMRLHPLQDTYFMIIETFRGLLPAS